MKLRTRLKARTERRQHKRRARIRKQEGMRKLAQCSGTLAALISVMSQQRVIAHTPARTPEDKARRSLSLAETTVAGYARVGAVIASHARPEGFDELAYSRSQ